jgi:hypothetical protein
MVRIHKTISFKEKIYKKIDDERGKKSFSTHVNDKFEELYGLKDSKKKKKIEK